MSATLTPSTSRGPSDAHRSTRAASTEVTRPILLGLGIFAVLVGIGLAVALVTSATLLFNVLVWALFTVLWIAFAAALAFSPRTLDDLWQQIRQLPLVIQGVVWLLFLPITIGLWIWDRSWSLPIRLVLIVALGAWNIFMFLPRSL